jgi:FkbM family methyltransferase
VSIEDIYIQLLPRSLRLPGRYYYHQIRNRLEKEIFYLNKLGKVGGRAIDIGANQGMYSYALSKLFEIVEAFEPQTWCTTSLVDFSKSNGRKINVHNVGLSNVRGTLELQIPINKGKLISGLATFRSIAGETKTIQVPVHNLDDYNFTDVAFIKIDVEGHESKVIEGGIGTIQRNKPIILVEIEQKHLQKNQHVSNVFHQIEELGYEGSFLQADRLLDIHNFSSSIHQDIGDLQYVRNFFFKPLV